MGSQLCLCSAPRELHDAAALQAMKVQGVSNSQWTVLLKKHPGSSLGHCAEDLVRSDRCLVLKGRGENPVFYFSWSIGVSYHFINDGCIEHQTWRENTKARVSFRGYMSYSGCQGWVNFWTFWIHINFAGVFNCWQIWSSTWKGWPKSFYIFHTILQSSNASCHLW